MLRALGETGLLVHPLCLGGNVFGWSATEAESFAVLDAYVAAGGNFIDTADMYSTWEPGHTGGESETILGRWMSSRKNRSRLIVATKVGLHPRLPGLSEKNIVAAVEASLQRLATDRIDLYYAHRDDPKTPLDETLRAFDALVKAGKVRHIAASNYSAARLAEARDQAEVTRSSPFQALQTKYNLMDRADYEGPLSAWCARERVPCVPYYGLARGFLSGKYRPGRSVESVRADAVVKTYLGDRGTRVLAALDAIAAAHRTSLAAVALAWLAARPTVASVIASARTEAQLADLLPMATLQLEAEETERLDRASEA
jgi:aryl-alcohol dehydrogenase (NADP+)